jgi:kynureninase
MGARLHIVRSDDGVSVPAERIASAIDDETLFVHTGHVYFRSGAVQDVAAVVEAAHEHDALALIDGYQAAGTVPVDVQALDVDFYVGGSHKWLCGGPGASYLYVRKDMIPDLRPSLTGRFGLGNPFAYARDLGAGEPRTDALRFLDGTPNVPCIYAARAGVRVVADAGVKAIRDHASRLTQAIIGHAKERGMKVRTPEEPDARSGMVCLDFRGADKAPAALSKKGIVCDFRADCGLRVSAHLYNDASDVQRLFEELRP